MTLDVLKAQARRLQTFLRTNPTHAAGLTEGKHASCLEAIAAVNGARNWNTLQASAKGSASVPAPTTSADAAPQHASDAPPDLPAVMGGAYPGQVLHLQSRVPGAKCLMLKCDIAHALAEGYLVTLLDVGSDFHHLAHAFEGFSTTFAQAHLRGNLPTAPVACFDFQGWQLTSQLLGADAPPVHQRWEKGVGYLQERTGRGHIVVLNQVARFQRVLGEQLGLLLNVLAQARAHGTLIVVAAESETELQLVRSALPADLAVVHKR